MSDIVVRRRHRLPLARAKRLAESIADRLRQEFDLSYAWHGNTLHVQRTGASGQVEVTKSAIEIRVELGFLLSPLRSRVEKEIHAFCDEQFGAAGDG